LAEILKDLERLPDRKTLATIGKVLAPGRYSVMLVRLTPRLAIPGDESDYFAREAVDTWGLDPYFGVAHSPHTPYYRLGSQPLGDVPYGGRRLGVVLGVPLYPPLMLDPEVVGSYREALRTNSSRPTVLALGLVADRGPATWHTQPDYTRHLVVTLYILDGHHKIAAAAQVALAVQFLGRLYRCTRSLYWVSAELGRHRHSGPTTIRWSSRGRARIRSDERSRLNISFGSWAVVNLTSETSELTSAPSS
jgi:hypothetical protein